MNTHNLEFEVVNKIDTYEINFISFVYNYKIYYLLAVNKKLIGI